MFLAKPGVGDYDLSVKPIDMVDALAQAHDIGEDFVNYKGYNHPDYTANDIRFVRGLEAYYEKALYDDNYKDPFTGRKPSKEAIEAASNAINLFTWKISGKKSRANELLKKGEYTQEQYSNWQKEVQKAATEKIILPLPNSSNNK